MQEETLQSRTEVIETGFAIRGLNEAVLGAAAVAHRENFAFPAITRKGAALCFSETSLRLAIQQLIKRRFVDAAQSVVAINEVIAREKIAIMLKYRNLTAGFAEYTQRMLQSKGWPGSLFESLNGYTTNIALHPLIKYPA
jgi:hypothetical protein